LSKPQPWNLIYREQLFRASRAIASGKKSSVCEVTVHGSRDTASFPDPGKIRRIMKKLTGESCHLQEGASLGLFTLEPLAVCSLPDGQVKIFSLALVQTPAGKPLELEGGWNHPFFTGQNTLLTAPLRLLRRGSLDHALSLKAFSLLPGILDRLASASTGGTDSAASELLEELSAARITGRGGSGYPAALKWKRFFSAPSHKQYGKLLICNGDEGNPGAYMDRLLLDGDPWSIMEAMALAALVSGAETGIIYLRREYTALFKRLKEACRLAEEAGFLGRNILNSGRAFHLYPVLGAGAYICGEESALIRSLEGEIPEPAQRPPYPSEQGYCGAPTLVHNVETWASIAAALKIGSRAFAAAGSSESGGTKLLSFSGSLPVPAMVEVPFGTPLKKVLELVASLPGPGEMEGASEPAPFQEPYLLQMGGPSGGFLRPEQFKLPVDYRILEEQGAPLGSGGIIVLPPHQELRLIRNMLSFSIDESCGACTPCREGLPFLLSAFDRCFPDPVQSMEPSSAELAGMLLDAALSIGDGSFCGLGSGAVLPLIRFLGGRTAADPGRSREKGDPCLLETAAEDSGLNLKQLLEKQGIPLPGLCFDPRLPPGSHCRCCLVESGGKILSSCSVGPADFQGDSPMDLYPDSERARRARRFSLLLASRHSPGSGRIRQEFLQAKIALDDKGIPLPEELYPGERLLFQFSDTAPSKRCILCGLCISACSEVPERHVLDRAFRGAERVIDTAFGSFNPDCIGCGACSSVCPVDVIRIEPW
jgi:bidirectional [NiFe] hydrogenase diaphorase subunit